MLELIKVDGYSQEDFNALLEELVKIEGRFLLSSYRNKTLNEFVKKIGWFQVELKMAKAMTAQTGKTLSKIEVITTNYPIGIIENNVRLL